MSDFTRPVEDLGQKTTEYIDLRVDELKLKTAKGLSLTLSKLLYMLLVLFVVSIIMISIAVAVGGVMWIGEMVGSYAGGAAIVAAFFLLVLGVLVLLRKRLFRDTFVPLFIDLFFEDKK